MLAIIGLLPIWIFWAPNAMWKAIEVGFVAPIQAFIFALLTILYFGMASGHGDDHDDGAHDDDAHDDHDHHDDRDDARPASQREPAPATAG